MDFSKKRYTGFVIAIFFLLATRQQVTAQEVAGNGVLTKIKNELGLKDSARTTGLFLDIDKSSFKNGEQIWFSAYLLNTTEYAAYYTLHILLVDRMAGKLIKEERYVLDSGRGSGGMVIPDSLISGEYGIIAYTNGLLNNANEKYFQQSITIRGKTSPLFLSFFPSANNDTTMECRIRVNNAAAAGAVINFNIYLSGQAWQSGKVTANQFGSAVIPVPPTALRSGVEINGSVNYGIQTMFFNKSIDLFSPAPSIIFFAPGEYLHDNQSARLPFETKDSLGQPFSASVTLFEDDQQVAQETPDIYGQGVFHFMPHSDRKYTVAIEGTQKPIQQFPVIYPPAKYRLDVPRRIVDDTLVAGITGEGKFILVLHNDERIIYSVSGGSNNGNGLVKILVANSAKGIATLSLFDQFGNLQRSTNVFLNAKDHINVNIQFDSLQYNPQSKVTAHIKLIDNAGKPVQGDFSFSCALVQLVNETVPGIEQDPVNIDKALYNIQNSGTSRFTYNLDFVPKLNNWYDGHVLVKDKTPKKPLTLVVAGSHTGILKTDSSGRFSVPTELKRGNFPNKVFTYTSPSSLDYNIILDTPNLELNRRLAAKYFPAQRKKPKDVLREKAIFDSIVGHDLGEVIVKASKPSESGRPSSAKDFYCNEYQVCSCGTINCISARDDKSQNFSIKMFQLKHMFVRSPYPGEIFEGNRTGFVNGIQKKRDFIRIDSLNGIVFVFSCNYKKMPPYINKFDATWFPQTYLISNPVISVTPEHANRTTLYWAPSITTDASGDATIVFFTGNLTGNFLCKLQGITGNGVFTKFVQINVTKKETASRSTTSP